MEDCQNRGTTNRGNCHPVTTICVEDLDKLSGLNFKAESGLEGHLEGEVEDFDSVCNLSCGFDGSEFSFSLATLSFLRFLGFLASAARYETEFMYSTTVVVCTLLQYIGLRTRLCSTVWNDCSVNCACILYIHTLKITLLVRWTLSIIIIFCSSFSASLILLRDLLLLCF